MEIVMNIFAIIFYLFLFVLIYYKIINYRLIKKNKLEEEKKEIIKSIKERKNLKTSGKINIVLGISILLYLGIGLVILFLMVIISFSYIFLMPILMENPDAFDWFLDVMKIYGKGFEYIPYALDLLYLLVVIRAIAINKILNNKLKQ